MLKSLSKKYFRIDHFITIYGFDTMKTCLISKLMTVLFIFFPLFDFVQEVLCSSFNHINKIIVWEVYSKKR